MRVVFPGYLSQLHPSPLPLPVCPMLASGCPGLASVVRSHFPSPQWVRHSLRSLHSPPPWAGVAWEEGKRGGRRELVCWCECLLQRKLPPGLLLPLCAPSHLSLPRSSQYYPRLCVCSQPGEEVEPDGRRIGGKGGGDGDSWADLGPWGEERRG